MRNQHLFDIWDEVLDDVNEMHFFSEIQLRQTDSGYEKGAGSPKVPKVY